MMNLQLLALPDATPGYPVLRKVGPADLKDALAKGVNDFLPFLDFMVDPLYLVSLGILYATIPICLISGGRQLLFPLLRVSLWLALSQRLACTR